MPSLHMESEHVRDVARQASLIAGWIDDQANLLRQASIRLDWYWDGGNAQSFLGELRTCSRRVESQADELHYLAQRLMHEAEEWDEVASSFGFRDFGSFIARKVGGAGEILEDGVGDPLNWSWWDWFIERSGESTDIALDAANIPYRQYQGWGRSLNDWLFQNDLVNHPRAGWVSRMDTTGHILRSPGAQWGVPIFMGTIAGLNEGESWEQAIASSVMVTGVSQTVPVVGQVLLISSGVQLAGNLIAGGLEASGNHAAATALQEGMEAIDLNGYADDLADGIWDMVAPPYDQPPDFSGLQARARKFENWGRLIDAL